MMTHAEALARTSRLSTDALRQIVRLAQHPNPERLAFDSGHILTPDSVADILACRALMDPDNDRHAMAERFALKVLGWTLEPEVALR